MTNYNSDIEKTSLAYLVKTKDGLSNYINYLSTNCFTDDTHPIIFNSIIRLLDKGIAIDELNFVNRQRKFQLIAINLMCGLCSHLSW